jgi:hypothetical protein
MPEILNLMASLLLGSINRENLSKRVEKGGTLTIAGKKKLFQKVGAVVLVCY